MAILRHPLLYVWLMLAVVFGAAGYLGDQRAANPTFSAAQAQDKGKQAQRQQGDAGRSSQSPAQKDQPPSAEYQPNCRSRENGDLCAQRRMANAAEAQARDTRYGLWLVFWTLMATGAAAIAAWRTLKIMRQTAERELRAYLNIEGGNVANFDAGVPLLQLIVKNFGQTPAYDVTVCVSVMGASYPAIDFPPSPDARTTHFGVVGPQASFHARKQLSDPPMSDGLKQQIRDGAVAIYLFGAIEYRDAFAKARKTTFRLMHRGTDGRTKGVYILASCEGGNNAT